MDDRRQTLERIERGYQAQPDHLTKRCRLEQTLLTLIAQQWQDGQRLPGHRALCVTLGVARNTLAGVIESLTRQGHLITDHGRGTWVCKRLLSRQREIADIGPISRRAVGLLADVGASPLQSGAFVPGVPDIVHFPIARWRQLYSRITVPHNTLLLSYASGGYGPLKRAIAGYLARWRGIDCSLDQIVITEGAHHGLQLCALTLADTGDRVVMDSPFYWGARNVFHAGGLEIEHAIWEPQAGYAGTLPRTHPRLLYFTGAHHYPLGVRSVSAHKQSLVRELEPDWILEDDYEFGDGCHRELAFDPDAGNRILIGSFSKLMFPGLRLGYLVVPRGLSDAINRVRTGVFREGRLLDQAVLAAFIDDGDLDEWCRRMANAYLQRQQRLHDLLIGTPGVIAISPPAGNISLSLALSPTLDDERLSQVLLNRYQLIARPLSRVCSKGDHRRGLILGVGMVEGETLERQGRRLAEGIGQFVEQQR
ncbi:PLP-dependent aminotransferase family protein [Salinicola sp. CPA57]|uniref:aminotransferase-like domain-containing protein n=1 Tax=Salinicola sp. CPA57 TaxID=1949080 RepID=UPI000DA1B30B|nr:PLP-dependent aminotransferase family protein [Salinicola sp. CPA57]